MASNRRNFLTTTLGGMAGLSLLRGQGTAGPIASTPLADNLFLLTGAGANVIARTGSEGVLLVDGGLSERSAESRAGRGGVARRQARSYAFQYALASGADGFQSEYSAVPAPA